MCLYLEETPELLPPRWVRLWYLYHHRSLQDEPSRVRMVRAWSYAIAESVCKRESHRNARLRPVLKFEGTSGVSQSFGKVRQKSRWRQKKNAKLFGGGLIFLGKGLLIFQTDMDNPPSNFTGNMIQCIYIEWYLEPCMFMLYTSVNATGSAPKATDWNGIKTVIQPSEPTFLVINR
jgi:hypothetical protein